MRGVFVTATGTGVGKTFLSRGLARAWTRRGLPTAALKPVETGVEALPHDAVALARACAAPALANADGFVRLRAPLAPWSASLEGEPPLELDRLAHAVRDAARGHARVLVEGAGGLLVPLTERADVADLAQALGLPLVVVASDALGTLSHTRTALESAARRDLPVAAVVLVSAARPDLSARTNARVLCELVSSPVHTLAHAPDDDDALADAVEASGLVARLEAQFEGAPPAP